MSNQTARRILFAYSVRDEGSDRVARARRMVAAAFSGIEIVCPEPERWAELISALGHEGAYERVSSQVHGMVVLEHQGHVGRGTFGLLSRILRSGKPAWVLRRRPDGTPRLARVKSLTKTEIDDWAVRYAIVQVEPATTAKPEADQPAA